MREPKFRIPMKCTSCGKHGFFEDKWNIPQKKFIRVEFGWCCSSTAYRIIGEPQQYTSEKDENNKETCEADIVAANIYGGEEPQILEVLHEGTGFVINYEDSESGTVLLSEFIGHYKIIGNTHENPEL